jgi:DNA polymerase III sliding clamp (beta) subunit (PCNA family)
VKVVFNRETLSKALDVVERVLPNKAAMPLYQAIYVGVLGKTSVELRVTNGDQYLALTVAAKVTSAKAGDGVALPGEEFLRVVKVAPDAEVSLSVGAQSAQIASGGAQWTLRYLTGVSYSDAPHALSEETRDDAVGSTVTEGLRPALRKVQYAVAKTQNRPGFRQVLISDKGVVAADGRRAHVVGATGINGSKYLIPETVLDVTVLLLDLIGEGEATLETGDEGGWVRLVGDKVDFVSGRLAYDFPDVLNVMVKNGKGQKASVTVNRQELVKAVVVASTAEDEGAVSVSIDGGKLKVESESGSMKAQMELEVDSTLSDWQRWFTADLLSEMLGAFEGETVKLQVNDGEGGVLYVEEGAECAVLMPLAR